MNKNKPHTFRPGVLELESRVVPAVSAIRLTGGIVTVNSNNNPTTILVTQTASTVKVQDLTTNRTWNYAAAKVGRVDVYGGAAADNLISSGPAGGKVVRLFGGQGDDTLTGGKGREKFEGGRGGTIATKIPRKYANGWKRPTRPSSSALPAKGPRSSGEMNWA